MAFESPAQFFLFLNSTISYIKERNMQLSEYNLSSYVFECMMQLLDEEQRYVSPKEHKLFLHCFDKRYPCHDELHYRFWREQDKREPPEQSLAAIREYATIASVFEINAYFDYLEESFESAKRRAPDKKKKRKAAFWPFER